MSTVRPVESVVLWWHVPSRTIYLEAPRKGSCLRGAGCFAKIHRFFSLSKSYQPFLYSTIQPSKRATAPRCEHWIMRAREQVVEQMPAYFALHVYCALQFLPFEYPAPSQRCNWKEELLKAWSFLAPTDILTPGSVRGTGDLKQFIFWRLIKISPTILELEAFTSPDC